MAFNKLGDDLMNLTDKQERFCLEYIVDLNATQAAIRSGYSEDTARSIGAENLTKPAIRAYVRELMNKRSDDTLVDAYFVVHSLIENVKRCQQAEPVLEWDYEEKVMKPTGEWQYDSQGANKALELLGKHLGVFEKDNTQKKPEILELIISGQKFADKD